MNHVYISKEHKKQDASDIPTDDWSKAFTLAERSKFHFVLVINNIYLTP